MPLLNDIKLILVIAKDNGEMFTTGHILTPSYMTTISSDYTDVGAVVSRMVSRYQEQ
jgi:hypothetical protein